MNELRYDQDESHQQALRLALLETLGLLNDGPDTAFDGLLRAAIAVSACPVAGLALVDGERLHFRFRRGAPAEALPGDGLPLEGPLLRAGWLEFNDGGYLAGLPVHVEGFTIGALCVADAQPRQLLTRTAREALAGLGAAFEALMLARRPGASTQVPRHDQRRLAMICAEMRIALSVIDSLTDLIRGSPSSAGDARIAGWLAQMDLASAQMLGLSDEVRGLADMQSARCGRLLGG